MATRSHGMFQNPDGLGGSNLGCLGFLIVVFVTANVAARIMCIAVVCLAYGTDAYASGLRVASWKLSTLTDGSNIRSPWHAVLGLGTFLLWVTLIITAEAVATLVRRHRAGS